MRRRATAAALCLTSVELLMHRAALSTAALATLRMPIDINLLRDPARGGEPDRWREMTRKRNKPVELVDRVIDLDEVGAHWRVARVALAAQPRLRS